jgi:DNA-binding CsgD family transcriptional regulator
MQSQSHPCSTEHPIRFSPRQVDILSLVASGMCDKEIASRLKVAERTVRAHLEHVFHQHGFRSRSAAVAAWLTARSQQEEALLPDECPYPKPFRANFSECPAYQPRQATELDLAYSPLEPSWTCRHLTTKRLPNSDYRWYGACAVGDARARARWATGPERLRRIATLRQEFATVSAPYAASLWLLKGQQLSVRQSGGDAGAQTQAMKALAARLLTDMQAFLETQRRRFEEVHLPPDACMELARLALDHLIEQDSAELAWEIPESVRSRFPGDAQLFLRPGLLSHQAPPKPVSEHPERESASALSPEAPARSATGQAEEASPVEMTLGLWSGLGLAPA